MTHRVHSRQCLPQEKQKIILQEMRLYPCKVRVNSKLGTLWDGRIVEGNMEVGYHNNTTTPAFGIALSNNYMISDETLNFGKLIGPQGVGFLSLEVIHRFSNSHVHYRNL